MKFFPSDWLGDQALSRCSLAAQGLWIRLVCVMHQDGADYGVMPFMPDGEAIEVARIGCCSVDEAGGLLAQLEHRGVFSRHPETKRIYSRRMVRDSEISGSRANAGRSGGFATAKTQQTVQQSAGVLPQQNTQQSVASGIWPLDSGSGSLSSETSKASRGKRSAGQPAEVVAGRAEYADLLADLKAAEAWQSWLEWCGTSEAKARRPAGKQAAAILNHAKREGPVRFAAAVEYAIAGNYLQPCYQDAARVNGTAQADTRTPAHRALDEAMRRQGSFLE